MFCQTKHQTWAAIHGAQAWFDRSSRTTDSGCKTALNGRG